MITFIKKLKIKEGVNSFDIDKIKKGIPEGYKSLVDDPTVTFTGNHVVIAYQCERTAKPSVKPKIKNKAKSKKVPA